VSTGALTRPVSPTRDVLDNGVVVLAHESTATPSVSVNATFYCGSANDPPDLPGVAYLTRRTIDRGTSLRSAADVAETLDDRGVSLRVSASRHTLTIACVCLSEDFGEILSLIADIARRPVFPAEEIDKRRIEAITSLREDQDDPSKVARDLLLATLYGAAHPYGRTVKGTVESLGSITRRDLVEFHARYMVPSALRVAIVGDVAGGAAVTSAARSFDEWRQPASPDEPIAPPVRHDLRSVRTAVMPGKSQADICYGFTTIRRVDPRYYAYWMMNNVLGQFGLGGRLADNIRERQGMAYYAYSSFDATVGEGPLIIRAGVDPANVTRTIGAIDDEVRALGADGPTRREFEDTRDSLIAALPRMLETNESIAEFIQYTEQFGLGLDFDRRLPSCLSAVSMDDVREAAREVLDPLRAAVAVAGPRE